MATPSLILVERDPRGVLTLALNRPEKRNALSARLLEELNGKLAEARHDPELKLLVITGEGEAFCAGGDLREFLEGDASSHWQQTERVKELFLNLFLFPLPTLALVNGLCLAGGLGIALTCDLILASEEAEFGAPEILVNLWPFMLSLFMFRNLPEKLALELIYTGRRLKASRAFELGLINSVVPPSQLAREYEARIAPILERSPKLLREGKGSLIRHFRLPYLAPLLGLRQDFFTLLEHPRTREGLRNFFQRNRSENRKE